MNSLVSIIMPAYQAASTIEKSIQSILKQTYINWELIICVDAATDATAQIAAMAAKHEKRIRLLVSKKNRGVVRSRNLGIRLAKGNYVAFCDADDWWDKMKLERQLNHMSVSGANFCYSSAIYVSNDGTWLSRPARMPTQLNLSRLLKGNPIGLSTAIYDIKKLGKLYFEKLPFPFVHEDYAYWLDLFQHTNILAVYDPNPEVFVLMDPKTRSGNKLLALHSQYFILRNKAKLSRLAAFFSICTYLIFALYKRGWTTWLKQLGWKN